MSTIKMVFVFLSLITCFFFGCARTEPATEGDTVSLENTTLPAIQLSCRLPLAVVVHRSDIDTYDQIATFPLTGEVLNSLPRVTVDLGTTGWNVSNAEIAVRANSCETKENSSATYITVE